MTLVWGDNANHTVAASGDLDFAVEGNPDLTCFTFAKVSGGNLTGITVRRSLDGGTTWGGVRTIASGLPLSTAGDAIDIDLEDELVTNVRFGLVVSASTVLHITGRASKR